MNATPPWPRTNGRGDRYGRQGDIARLDAGEADDALRLEAGAYREAYAAFLAAMARFAEMAGCGDPGTLDSETLLHDLTTVTEQIGASAALLRDWTSWCGVRRRAEERGLAPLIADLESGAVAPGETQAAFELAYARWWLPPTIDADGTLRDFRRFQHEHAIEEFREIDDLVRAKATARVVSAIAHGLPAVQSVPRNSELGLLRHQMELQRPSRSIREMIGALPQSFAKLAPCMLMSPLSIAQYFPASQSLFDVVIFDEASQITTWDAVGAIARGRQTIIVGDPKQLPPTNFFGRNEDEEDVADHERDLESILDEAKAAGIPVRDLRWHYRSRSESLIAFSNAHYYQNRLITFPAPTVSDRAVRLVHVDGVYDRGKSRTNRTEAQALVDDAVRRMRHWLSLPEAARPTLGIVTFNAQQQSLIHDLLDEARRREAELEWFFSDDRVEPTIVRNLENVQGDERDVILFSITFSRDAAGKRLMDFGALNRDGGERRLNVAVTRARQELVIFSGFRADDVIAERTKAIGVHHLKAFLDFADRGSVALAGQAEGSVGGYDSPFEEAVAEALTRLGWQTVPQVGMSGFRIDIGIRHPDRAGAFLAGVECDGATYHSAATARDRDKVREQVLRGLGWNILRVWSTDWWFDASGATARLHEALTTLLQDSRQGAPDSAKAETQHWALGDEVDPGQGADPSASSDELADDTGGDYWQDDAPILLAAEPPAAAWEAARALVRSAAPERMIEANASDRAVPVVVGAGAPYRVADISQIPADPERFHDADYQATLQRMVQVILEAEAPIRDDLLAQRVARAHGWLRTGSRIRERLEPHTLAYERTSESVGDFLWLNGTVAPAIPHRAVTDEAFRRSVTEIPLPELAGLVLSTPSLDSDPDPALALARLLGMGRLAATSRARLEEAIGYGRRLGAES